MATKRRRRTAEEAREAILQAAEQRLITGGAAGIRLTEVARAVGVSHPTVLHHFGNRDGLIDAVVARALDSLHADVVAAIVDGIGADGHIKRVMARVHEAIDTTGHARTMAWLTLEGMLKPEHHLDMSSVIDAAHAARTLECSKQGLPTPDRQDTAFTVVLATFVLFGQSIIGTQLMSHAGMGGQGPEFRDWFAEIVRDRLDDPCAPPK